MFINLSIEPNSRSIVCNKYPKKTSMYALRMKMLNKCNRTNELRNYQTEVVYESIYSKSFKNKRPSSSVKSQESDWRGLNETLRELQTEKLMNQQQIFEY